MADPDLENLVVTLAERGWSQRRLARELGISRNTVRGILDRVEMLRSEGHDALPRRVARPSMLDAFETQMKELLTAYPNITAVRMHEELQKRGFEGSYTIVRERVRLLRPRAKVTPARRIETAPGQQGQQDWSPYTIPFTEQGPRKVHAFSLILSFSRRQYLHFSEREDFFTLIRQHVAAFERFEGVPAEILYDRQKAVVLGREGGRDLYNPRFLAFATYYRFRPRALPPRKPQWKGKVERPFRYVEGNCLNARTFRHLDDLNQHAAWWMDHRSDVHPHRRTGQPPIERFAEERDHLRPLPARPYDTAEIGYRFVDREGFVSWEGTPYSVPYSHVLDLVVLRATADEIFVYGDDLKQIACHGRAPRGQAEPVTEPSHHPARDRKRRNYEALLARMTGLGPAGEAFAAGVHRSKRYWGAELAAVLAHQERYDLDDLLAALERAVHYRAFEARVVTRILEATATPRVLPDTLAETRSRLRETGATVSPRTLTPYAAAFRGDFQPE